MNSNGGKNCNKGITVLILAAGNSVRIGGVTKQLLQIGNTTIIGRIITQVRDCGYNPIVVTHNEEIQNYCSNFKVDYFVPEKHRVTCETLLSTESLWSDTTIVLLGDVIYSNATIDTIFDAAVTVPETQVYGDTWEIYAVTIHLTQHGVRYTRYETIRDALEWAKGYRGGKLRYFYRLLTGFDIDAEEVEGEPLERFVFKYIHDWTRDIDMMSEYDRALIELVNTGVLGRE